jgi:hypothetical protein
MERAAAFAVTGSYKLYKLHVTDESSPTQLDSISLIASEHRTFSCVNTRVYLLLPQELHSQSAEARGAPKEGSRLSGGTSVKHMCE